MAFTDVVVTCSDRTVLLVDRHAQPGGHWNHAYPFVRLHQPSAFYGVASRPLGRHVRDVDGLNEGLYEQATGQQVLAYFDEVLREQFLPSGRVQFLPMSEYVEGGTVVSEVTGQRTIVRARRRVVDARYLGSEVPSLHTPTFAIGEGVRLIPVNGLASLSSAPPGYVVLGAGKTSIDACLWLLDQGVDPQRIIWVRPHDLWLLNRAQVQPDARQLVAVADMIVAASQASDVDDLVERLEQAQWLLRIDRDFWPTTFRGATASPREVDVLRRIDRVVRLGHVTGIERGVVRLEGGEFACDDGWIFVDCTAEGLRRRPVIPIFQPDRITLEYVMPFGHPTYSSSVIARVELSSDDDAVKNEACPAQPVPNELGAIASYLVARLGLPRRWAQLPGVLQWNDALRLNMASWALAAMDPQDEAPHLAITRMLEASEPAEKNLERILQDVRSSESPAAAT